MIVKCETAFILGHPLSISPPLHFFYPLLLPSLLYFSPSLPLPPSLLPPLSLSPSLSLPLPPSLLLSLPTSNRINCSLPPLPITVHSVAKRPCFDPSQFLFPLIRSSKLNNRYSTRNCLVPSSLLLVITLHY